MASRKVPQPRNVAERLALFHAAAEWSLGEFCDIVLRRTDQWGRNHLTGSTPGQRPNDTDQEATLTALGGVQIPVYKDHNRNWRIARHQYEAAIARNLEGVR